MVRLLKQSTAKILRVGPFVDSGDGVTAETGLTIAQADIQISKNGGAFAQTSEASPTTTHDADGWYQIPLTTTDTNTLGPLTVQIAMAGALPVWEHFMVVPANIYDSLVGGSDYLDVSLVQWLGTAPKTLSAEQVQAVVPDAQKVDLNTIKTKSLTCASAVTVLANVGFGAAPGSQNGPPTLDANLCVQTDIARVDGVEVSSASRIIPAGCSVYIVRES